MRTRSPRARVGDLGATVEGRDLNVVTVGTPGEGRKSLWIIARQHPGETMAEWFVEGMLDRLLDASDPVARGLTERAVVRIVPNMNPDGGVRGNLRTNAAGRQPQPGMDGPDTGTQPGSPPRACGDAGHRRRRLPGRAWRRSAAVRLYRRERAPRDYSPRMAALEQGFRAALQFANPDFQMVHGYAADKETKVNLTIASKWAGHTFGGLALTLEMPFKDNAERPIRFTAGTARGRGDWVRMH